MKLKDKLQKLRKEHDLSQEQLAYKLNVSRQAVSKWESGSAYPEMDKILAISKIFNCSVEYLTNDDLVEMEDRNKKDNQNFSKYIKNGLDFVTNTMNMFYSMKFRSLVKCLFELTILIFIICIVESLIALGIISVIESIISFMPESILYTISNIFSNIILLIAIISGIVIVGHIFKVRYLDYYEQTISKSQNKDSYPKNSKIEKGNDDNQDNYKDKSNSELFNNNHKLEINKGNKIEIDNNCSKFEYIEKKDPKIIIRDPKDQNFAIFEILFKWIKIFVKIIVGCISSIFVISFSSLIVFLIILLYLLFDEVIFGGLILIVLGVIVINYEVLNIVYRFLVSRKQNTKRIYIVLVVGVILASIGTGICIIDLKDYTYIDNINDIRKIEEYEKEYKITQDFYILASYKTITYIEDNKMQDGVIRVKLVNDKRFTESVINELNGFIEIYDTDRTISLNDIYNIFKIEAKKKVIRNYDNLLETEIYVYGSKNSLEVLKHTMNIKFYNWVEAKNSKLEKIHYYYTREVIEE
ncbi:MAG: helix-turn-helix transcriptional regulator [Bacilli bacterium]|nr:helix-turn-helix transcriptional regulator [Bacilli bacterium]